MTHPTQPATDHNTEHNLSEHSLRYLAFCHTFTPTSVTVATLRHLAAKVPQADRPQLMPLVRTVAIERCTATLNRARSGQATNPGRYSPEQLKSYERYLGMARTGHSLMEEMLTTNS